MQRFFADQSRSGSAYPRRFSHAPLPGRPCPPATMHGMGAERHFTLSDDLSQSRVRKAARVPRWRKGIAEAGVGRAAPHSESAARENGRTLNRETLPTIRIVSY